MILSGEIGSSFEKDWCYRCTAISQTLPDTDDDSLDLRNIERERSTREETIEEYYFDGVHCVLAAFEEPKFSQVFWRLLAKAVSLEQGNRDALFQATYRWFYRHPKEKPMMLTTISSSRAPMLGFLTSKASFVILRSVSRQPPKTVAC